MRDVLDTRWLGPPERHPSEAETMIEQLNRARIAWAYNDELPYPKPIIIRGTAVFGARYPVIMRGSRLAMYSLGGRTQGDLCATILERLARGLRVTAFSERQWNEATEPIRRRILDWRYPDRSTEPEEELRPRVLHEYDRPQYDGPVWIGQRRFTSDDAVDCTRYVYQVWVRGRRTLLTKQQARMVAELRGIYEDLTERTTASVAYLVPLRRKLFRKAFQ